MVEPRGILGRGGPGVPFQGLGRVLGPSRPVLGQKSELDLGLGVARPGGLAQPRGGLGRVGREVLREMTDEAMLALAALLPAEMQGDYAERTSNARWLVYPE